MKPPIVAIMAPGDMGHAVGRVLVENGLRVVTALGGRSARTAELAAGAGLCPLSDDATLVREADVLLSILPPARAVAVAERMAESLRKTGAELLFVDCNAVSPATARTVGSVITAAGSRFVDAGIIGAPPRAGGPAPRFYASGADVAAFAELGAFGLDIRPIGAEPGQASALKMCYAALTKGLIAIQTEALVAGRTLGIEAPLLDELRFSQSDLLTRAEATVPGMPPKAYRWVGEMEEIAATFAAAGLTPRIFEGAADLYRFVEATPLGQEIPEQRRLGRTLTEVMELLADTNAAPIRSTGT